MTYKTLLICVCILIAAPQRASSSSTEETSLIDHAMLKMAVEIKAFLQGEGLPLKIVVGDFTAPPHLKASGGVQLSRTITGQLEAAGISISDDAAQQLMGKFKLSTKKQHAEDDFESVAMDVEATVLDANDQELNVLSFSVFGSVALQITGQTVDVPVELPEKERQETLIRQIKDPTTYITQGKVKSSEVSSFAIEVLVNDNDQMISRVLQLDRARRAFVEMQANERFAVRLHNGRDFEVAVKLTVDGVNVFIDAKDVRKDSLIIVRPGAYVDVHGWYRSATETEAFHNGGFESVSGVGPKSDANFGTLTASYRACWHQESSRPDDERSGIPKCGTSTTQVLDTNSDEQLTRSIGQLRTIISVRYQAQSVNLSR